jgi:hypothetical protein
MLARSIAATPRGIEARPVQVEVQSGLPQIRSARLVESTLDRAPDRRGLR